MSVQCLSEKKAVDDQVAKINDLRDAVSSATGAAKQGFARLLQQARVQLPPLQRKLDACMHKG